MNNPNIVLIVLDTVRNDVFSKSVSSGYMPYLSSLSRDFNRFEKCIAPSPWTVPSHVSLFTGMYPSEHNVHEDKNNKQSEIIMDKILNYEGNTLTESLKEFGYSTYGFVANPNLMPGTGFERGFDYLSFSDMFSDLTEAREKFKKTIQRKYPNTYKDIINLANNFSYEELRSFIKTPSNIMKIPYLAYKYRGYIKEMKSGGYPESKAGKDIVNNIAGSHIKEPFFMFVNLMEAHDPYILANGELFSGEANKMLRYLSGDSNISKKQLFHFEQLYRNELSILDRYVEKIINYLIATNSYENSVIVITSDHGQNFGEDHYYGHGVLLSESLLRVPLMVKLPGHEISKTSEGYQSLVNIYKFLLNSGKGMVDTDLLTSNYVFAETFGIQENYRKIFKKNSDIIQKLTKFDKRRMAIYWNDHKILLDVHDNYATFEGNFKPSTEIYNITSEFLGSKYKIKERAENEV